MPQDEMNTWVAYIEENGPLNLSLRIESAIARAVAPFLKDAKPRDLMIWPKEPEKPADIHTVFAGFQNLASQRTRNK